MEISETAKNWWAPIGKQIDEFPLNFLQDPQFAFADIHLRLIKTDHDTFVVLTDGLREYEGSLGEFFIETSGDLAVLNGAWQTSLVIELCSLLSKDPAKFSALLEKHDTVTISLDMEGAPDEWSLDDPRGNIGLFVNLPHPYPVTNLRLINAKLMRPAELKYAIDEDDRGGRDKLQTSYEAQGDSTVSSMDRPSVI